MSIKTDGEREHLLDMLLRISRGFGQVRDRQELVEQIFMEARELVGADGGSLYLVRDGRSLHFEIMRNDTLGIHEGGVAVEPCQRPPVPLFDDDGQPNYAYMASRCYWSQEPIIIDDVKTTDRVDDVTKIKAFDDEHNYTTTSFWSIPLLGGRSDVLGVIQLVNARDPQTGLPVAFDARHHNMIEALSCLAAIALENHGLVEAQRELLESFIQVIAAAIDAKSPYTGAHCARVPVLSEMLIRAACQSQENVFADFNLTESEWQEVRIAAWLHDCGKISTPPHVMDKATKLQTIVDRIHHIETRIELAITQAELKAYKAAQQGHISLDAAMQQAAATSQQLRDAVVFLRRVNQGAEWLDPADQERLKTLAAIAFEQDGQTCQLITQNELENLLIERGTLTQHERLIINSHMVHTIEMLEALPFPPELARVPEYACGHHERMDGRGYPMGIHAGTMSLPARSLAIADVFEALTASDRPYKPSKKLSEAMSIMGKMKQNNHLDPDLFDLFVRSGVYREFAVNNLDASLIDAVDEAALLSIEPRPLPDEPLRSREGASLLPEFQGFTRQGRG